MGKKFDDSDDKCTETCNINDDDDDEKVVLKQKRRKIYDIEEEEERKEDFIKNYQVNLDELDQFGPRKEYSELEANAFISFVIGEINKLERDNVNLRKLIFFILFYDLGRLTDGNKSTLKRLRKCAGVCRDTIHKYISIAKVEKQLSIQNGVIPVQALMALYKCEPKTRPEIFEIAKEYQKKDEEEFAATPKKGRAKRFMRKPKPYPGKKHVELAVKHFNKLKEAREEQIANGDDPDDVEVCLSLPRRKSRIKNKDLPRKIFKNPLDIWHEEDKEDIELLYMDDKEGLKEYREEELKLELNNYIRNSPVGIKKKLLNIISAKKSEKPVLFHAVNILIHYKQSQVEKIARYLNKSIREQSEEMS